MSIELDTRNGHDKEIVDRFNAISQKYGDDGLLDHILSCWADDSDLLDITITLEDRHWSNEPDSEKWDVSSMPPHEFGNERCIVARGLSLEDAKAKQIELSQSPYHFDVTIHERNSDA